MANKFTSFFGLFHSEPGYLELLDLSAPQAKKSISLLLQCCRRSPDPYRDIDLLLEGPNWRPNLVAAVALAALGYREGTFKKLWNAIDAGSWVTPQLAVTAFLRDPTFSEQAQLRIQSRCPLKEMELGSMSALEQHVAAGPAGSAERSAKTAASLVELAKQLPQTPGWLGGELSNPDLARLLAKDIDHSSSIAKEWLTRVKKMLSAEGIVFS